MYDVVTQRIIAQLERGTVPWRRPWSVDVPANLLSQQVYRGINLLLLSMAGYASPWWLTFNQARGLGGHVRKGEKSTPIVFWKWKERVDIDEETGEKTTRKDALVRYYHVFNIEQCEGVPDAKIPRPHGYAGEPLTVAEAIVDGMPNAPAIEHRGGHACYVPQRDTVYLPPRERFESAETYYATLFHELTHNAATRIMPKEIRRGCGAGQSSKRLAA